MKNINHIFFDGMETLIDLVELPGLRGYALWAYEGSGMEHLWKDFEEFFVYYKNAREAILKTYPLHQEHEVYERLLMVSNIKLEGNDIETIQSVAHRLYSNFWDTYRRKCYVKDEVKEVLAVLAEKYPLGVVSNFLVQGGIEELLEIHGIAQHFHFVVTSINTGWQKPHVNIYKAALEQAGIVCSEILFVGDDYVNDYVTPRKIGFKTVLLDRFNRHPEIEERVTDFYQLKSLL